ncbi:hypothetical protein [Lactococcus formosensis]|uniref:HTH-type transcriptional regulator Rgg C-terminal domain-containing protein n=1 Tax=Lactococcus formosensis TaxID=1281486 RepID=A0A9X4SFY9_9LACT|nr:hypothetical protein [Lactococcus formosensis]MDG6126602.1 hypothetical protein [Lactococcus formosensis]MDG6131710.1 hypothetical protein [Lactococcus formosensis]MDG6133708.1 hypothetical protein [Lactococcus formosensis]MDG6140666.1 hypothetical protein [Lactococcus formosensis]MDG6146217.1 hypothetical protein [Lactococcus formosensis]
MQIYYDNIYYDIDEDYFIALAAKACYEELNTEEKMELEGFFSSCEMWSRYELNLFINVMLQINQDLTFSIINKLSLSKYEYLRERREYRSLFARIIIKSILIFITQEKQKKAEGLIKYLKELPPIIDITEKVVGLFLEGCYIYKFEDSQMGNKIVRRSLRILLDVEALELKTILEFYYKNTINSKKKNYLLIN